MVLVDQLRFGQGSDKRRAALFCFVIREMCYIYVHTVQLGKVGEYIVTHVGLWRLESSA